MVLKLQLPLEPGVLRVIAAVQAGAQSQGVEPLLVGAAARDLLLVHVYGQRVRRAAGVPRSGVNPPAPPPRRSRGGARISGDRLSS